MAAQVTFLSYLWLQILMDTFLDCPEIVYHIVNEKSNVKQKRPLGFKKKKQASERTRASYLAMNSIKKKNKEIY